MVVAAHMSSPRESTALFFLLLAREMLTLTSDPCKQPAATIFHMDTGAGTLIPSAQRLVWAGKQPLGNAALGALFA